jgi:flagellar assembly protein FliH
VVKVHCFPEITGSGVSRPAATAEEECFQRIDFRTVHGGAAPDPDRPDPEEIRRQAYRKGYQDGEKAGAASETAKAAPVIEGFRRATFELERLRRDLYRSAERRAMELALAVARKIVAREVQVQPEVVLSVVRKALERVAAADDIRIRVHPADLDYLEAYRRELAGLVENVDRIDLVADETTTRGGCLIETGMGGIDARIEKQLECVEALFLEEVNRWTEKGDGGDGSGP